MELTSLYLLVLVNSMVTVSAEVQNSGDVMRASLRFSPDRSQFFRYESVFMSCEDRQSNSTVWRVKRINIKNITSECGGVHPPWGSMNSTGCHVRSMKPSDGGVYWCDSSKGKSNTVNMTVTDATVILESPVCPVMEGSDVTLHCWSKYKTIDEPSSDLPAGFYKDGSLIRSESTGQMTIHSVSKSDEGFYKCYIANLGESPKSWMYVNASGSVEPSSPPVVGLSLLVVGLIVGLVVVILTILLVLLCRNRTSRNPCCVRFIQSQGTNESGAPDVSSLQQQDTTGIYEVMTRSDHLANDGM